MLAIENIFSLIDNPALQKKIFLDLEGTKYTYGDVIERTNKLSAFFIEHGLKPGNKVILSVTNDYDTCILFFALLRCGITAILVDGEVKKQRIQSIIKVGNPDGYILQENLFTEWAIETENKFFLIVKDASQKKGLLFKKLLGNKYIKQKDSSCYPALLHNLTETFIQPHFDEKTIAYIIFTSGTTSHPKGVQISHNNVFTHLITLKKVYELNQDSNILNTLLIYHADGIIQGPLLTLCCQATIYRPLKFSIGSIGQLFDSIYKFRITHFFAVPAMLSLMNKFSDSYKESFLTDKFKFIISVSSHIEENLWEELSKKFKVQIINVYGLTESVAGSFFCGPAKSNFKLGTIGKPVDTEAAIVNEKGEVVRDGEEGELLMRGEHIMMAYLNNEKATNEAIKDGWLHTGDIALKDAAGFYRITGRKKNIIISGGFNIHPEEVTEVIHLHAEVLDCVSLGVADEVFNEKLISCVVLRNGSPLLENDIIQFCRQHLEENKVPTQIYFLDKLPKGLSGKVQIDEVKEIVSRQQLKPVSNNFQNKIFEIAAGSFKVPTASLSIDDTSNTVSGWDSLAHLHFITELENQFNVKFKTAEIMIMNSLSQTENVLKQKIRA